MLHVQVHPIIPLIEMHYTLHTLAHVPDSASSKESDSQDANDVEHSSSDITAGRSVRNPAKLVLMRLVGKRARQDDADHEYQPPDEKNQRERPPRREASGEGR